MLTIDPSSLPTGVTRSDFDQATVTIVDNACKQHYVYNNDSFLAKIVLSPPF